MKRKSTKNLRSRKNAQSNKPAFPKTDGVDKLTLMLIRGRLLAISTRKIFYIGLVVNALFLRVELFKKCFLLIFYKLKWKQRNIAGGAMFRTNH